MQNLCSLAGTLAKIAKCLKHLHSGIISIYLNCLRRDWNFWLAQFRQTFFLPTPSNRCDRCIEWTKIRARKNLDLSGRFICVTTIFPKRNIVLSFIWCATVNLIYTEKVIRVKTFCWHTATSQVRDLYRKWWTNEKKMYTRAAASIQISVTARKSGLKRSWSVEISAL